MSLKDQPDVVDDELTYPECEVCGTSIEDECEFHKTCSSKLKVCNSCFDGWISEQVRNKPSTTKDECDVLFLRCPLTDCRHFYDLSTLFQRIKFQKMHKLLDQLALNYCRYTNSIITCPNSKCINIGFYDETAKCATNLQCQICEMTWKMPSQRTPFGQFLHAIRQKRRESSSTSTIELIREINSEIYKLLFSQKCRSCGSFIIRNGGCKHMQCEKCLRRFCWDCGMTLNEHHNLPACYLRTFIRLTILLSPLFYLYYYLGLASFISQVPFISGSGIVYSSSPVLNRAIGLFTLLFRLAAYNAPLKIVSCLVKSIKSNNSPSSQQKTSQEIKQFLSAMMKWIIFLLISFVIIGYFGNMKEALAIATIEALVGAYAGLNNAF